MSGAAFEQRRPVAGNGRILEPASDGTSPNSLLGEEVGRAQQDADPQAPLGPARRASAATIAADNPS